MKNTIYLFGGVQMTEAEYKIIKAVADAGTCPYCGRTSLRNNFNSMGRHRRSCGGKLSLLDKEKKFAALIAEAKA